MGIMGETNGDNGGKLRGCPVVSLINIKMSVIEGKIRQNVSLQLLTSIACSVFVRNKGQ